MRILQEATRRTKFKKKGAVSGDCAKQKVEPNTVTE
jgi:hypothetical protein